MRDLSKNFLIAPCGMNCRLCKAYQRKKDVCIGCNCFNGDLSRRSRLSCTIRNCAVIESNESGFCYDCSRFPCRRLKDLDARYRKKYFMSMIDNLEFIRDFGLASFLAKEEERWACKSCGMPVCVHSDVCMYCGAKVDFK